MQVKRKPFGENMMFRTRPSQEWKARLVKTGTSDGGWTIHYKDAVTSETWIEYFPYPEDRAPSYFRKADLPSDPEVLLRTCLQSEEEEDWQGVGAHCSGAFDTELVADLLERLSRDVPRQALKEFGRFFHPYDNRKIVGMHYTEVEASYNRYLKASERIKAITQ